MTRRRRPTEHPITPAAVHSEQLPQEVAEVLQLALERGATDALLAADRTPSLQVSAALAPIDKLGPSSEAMLVGVARLLLGDDGLAQLERNRDRDFAFEVIGLARFRGSFYYQRGGLALALRVLPASIPSLDELGLPSAVARLALLPRGLILVTGPTGSGKSTTLAALIEVINRTSARHVLTIEDPVEFVHTDKLSRIEQRQVGPDTPSFERALRGVLRQSPDVVMVGEMRDAETIQTVLSLAETGHLTLATLHTSSSAKTVHRIIDVFPDRAQAQIRAQLALCLEAVLSQALLPRVGGGLVLATEIMLGTFAVRSMIRDGRVHQMYSAIQAGQELGMYTMNHALARLVRRGQVTLEDAVAHSADVEELRQLLAS